MLTGLRPCIIRLFIVVIQMDFLTLCTDFLVLSRVHHFSYFDKLRTKSIISVKINPIIES